MALIVGNVSGSAQSNSLIAITGSVIVANPLRGAATPAMPGTDVDFFISGSTKVNDSGVTVFGGDIVVSGTIYDADGGTSGVTITNATNNRVCTSAGGSAINSEANLTFDGTDVTIAGAGKIEFASAAAYINHDGTDLQLVDDADINLKPAVDLLVDAGGDIILDADGGQVTIKDGGASHYLFDCDATSFTIYDDQDTGDLFSITVAQHGATTIATTDDDATAGNLTLDIDGNIELNADGGEIAFKDAAQGVISFNHSATGQCDIENGAGNAVVVLDDGDRKLYFFDKGGEYIVGDGTDLDIFSGGGLNLAAGADMEFDAAGNDFIFIGSNNQNNLKITASGSACTIQTAQSGEVLNVTAGGELNLSAGGDMEFDAGGNDFRFIGNNNQDFFKITASGSAAILTTTQAGEEMDIECGGGMYFTAGGDIEFDVGGNDIVIVGSNDQEGLKISASGSAALIQTIQSGEVIKISAGGELHLSAGTDMEFDAGGNDFSFIGATNVPAFKITISGSAPVFSCPQSEEELYIDCDVLPNEDNDLNLGSATHRWANVFTGDLHLANDRGDWTVIEENDYLSLRNNKTGKFFRLLMEEVTEE